MELIAKLRISSVALPPKMFISKKIFYSLSWDMRMKERGDNSPPNNSNAIARTRKRKAGICKMFKKVGEEASLPSLQGGSLPLG